MASGSNTQREVAQLRHHFTSRGVGLLTAHYERQVFAPHWHDTWTIAVVRRGAMSVRIAGNADRLEPESVIVIPPGVVHSAGPAQRDGWDYCSIYLSEELLEPCRADLPTRMRSRLPTGVIRSRHLTRLCLELADHLERNELQIDRLAAIVERTWHAAPTTQARPVPEVDWIEHGKSFIAENLHRRLSLSEVAHAVGTSQFHFIRRFHRVVGVTPGAFLTYLRIERACSLLNAGVSIAECAFRCGFFDQSHLNRHFKQIVGVTPGSYLAGRVREPSSTPHATPTRSC